MPKRKPRPTPEGWNPWRTATASCPTCKEPLTYYQVSQYKKPGQIHCKGGCYPPKKETPSLP